MKDRLLQLIDMEHLTPSKFADLIGVQRSSVSHILSGRNKPSFDFLQKTLSTFPGLKADWLMLGNGPIYEHMRRHTEDLFDQVGQSKEESDELVDNQTELSPLNRPIKPEGTDSGGFSEKLPESANAEISPENPAESRKIVQVMLFYDDDTFTTHKPSL